MKAVSSLGAVLRLELTLGSAWGIAVVPAIFAFFFAAGIPGSTRAMTSFWAFPIFMVYHRFFSSRLWRTEEERPLEFFFSRAVDRGALFAAREARYLAFAVGPVLGHVLVRLLKPLPGGAGPEAMAALFLLVLALAYQACMEACRERRIQVALSVLFWIAAGMLPEWPATSHLWGAENDYHPDVARFWVGTILALFAVGAAWAIRFSRARFVRREVL